MKKFRNLLLLCALVFSFGLTGCGGADVDAKGAVKGKEETSDEMQKLIDETQGSGMAKQFGDRKDEAPTKEEDDE